MQDNGGTANGGIDLDPTPNTLSFNVTPVNDMPTGAVTIDDTTPLVNQTLSVSNTLADVDGMPNPVGYQWQSSANGTTWSNILGATATSFAVTDAQNGLLLRVRATFVDGLGAVEVVDSASTATVSSGSSIINGDAGANNLVGTDWDDQIFGFAGNDTLSGGLGADTLDGGTGNDTMIGSAGNDIYVVDSKSDVIIENANEGIDLVLSVGTWTLGANIEDLTLTGSGVGISGQGNSLNNVITGSEQQNWLGGGDGDDTLIGNGGDDVLRGDAGADSMLGGLGNDTYIVDSASDALVELADQGTDVVRSYVSWTLGENFENLVLLGTALHATGNDLDNQLTGNSGANTLIGLAGNDTLTGGLGNDTFKYDSTGESGIGVGLRDIITDFVQGQDRIDLAAIDANSGVNDNQAFSFIGTAAFTAAAQARYFYEGGNTVLELNVGGANSLTVDMQIQLTGQFSLLPADLIP